MALYCLMIFFFTSVEGSRGVGKKCDGKCNAADWHAMQLWVRFPLNKMKCLIFSLQQREAWSFDISATHAMPQDSKNKVKKG